MVHRIVATVSTFLPSLLAAHPFLCSLFYCHCRHTLCWPGLGHGVGRSPPYSRDPLPTISRGHHFKNCPHPSSVFTGCFLILALMILWLLWLGACTVWGGLLHPPETLLLCLPALPWLAKLQLFKKNCPQPLSGVWSPEKEPAECL